MKTNDRLITACTRYSALLAMLMTTLNASPAAAGEEVPFRARFQAIAEQTPTFPVAIVRVTAVGQATHLGSTLAVTDNERVDFITGLGTATYVLTAANGDEVVVEFLFTATPSGTGLTLEGTWQIVSGTGRFSEASGSGTTDGFVQLTSATSATAEFSMTGKLSTVGSAK